MEEKRALEAGARVGRLTLLAQEPPRNGRRYWHCRCDCGQECVVEAGHLRSGHSTSCGCARRERMKSLAYDLQGRRFDRLLVVEKTEKRRKSSVIWRCRCDCGQEIFCESDRLLRGHTRSCGCLREEQRKENMKKAIHFVDGTCIERIACQKENAANTSGHRGVQRRENGKWRACLSFRGKRYDLGTYASYELAVQARLRAEQLYYGEYLEAYYDRQEAAAVNAGLPAPKSRTADETRRLPESG